LLSKIKKTKKKNMKIHKKQFYFQLTSIKRTLFIDTVIGISYLDITQT